MDSIICDSIEIIQAENANNDLSPKTGFAYEKINTQSEIVFSQTSRTDNLNADYYEQRIAFVAKSEDISFKAGNHLISKLEIDGATIYIGSISNYNPCQLSMSVEKKRANISLLRNSSIAELI